MSSFSAAGLSQLDHLYRVLPELMVPHIFADRATADVRRPKWGDCLGCARRGVAVGRQPIDCRLARLRQELAILRFLRRAFSRLEIRELLEIALDGELAMVDAEAARHAVLVEPVGHLVERQAVAVALRRLEVADGYRP